jgi:hypothetical protein
VRVQCRLASPFAEEEEVVGVGDARRERVPHAAGLAGGIALGGGEDGSELLPTAADAEEIGDRDD